MNRNPFTIRTEYDQDEIERRKRQLRLTFFLCRVFLCRGDFSHFHKKRKKLPNQKADFGKF